MAYLVTYDAVSWVMDRQESEEVDGVELAKRQYRNGVIDEDQLEERLDEELGVGFDREEELKWQSKKAMTKGALGQMAFCGIYERD